MKFQHDISNERTDGHTDEPKPICSSDFFKVGNIISPELIIYKKQN